MIFGCSVMNALPVEELADVDLWPLAVDEVQQFLHVLLEDFEITEPILGKERTEQLPRSGPLLTIGCKDTVS